MRRRGRIMSIMSGATSVKGVGQEQIVFLITALLFAVFALTLPGFLSAANMLTLLRSVSVLGVLGLGMLIVVLGRGIDLSMVALMAISVAWSMQLIGAGTPAWLALCYGLGFAILMSLISGILIAYGEIPPLFATLAMGTFVYGFGRAHLIIGTDVV
ncbi:ABC transporter permease, partial [Escherichia coli]|nr:ABC transporter permease [Escherichia coli]